MLFTKRGDRVEAEAADLTTMRGQAGVVELAGVEDGVLRTVAVDGCSLAQRLALAPLSVDEVAGVAAHVATILADLHDHGVVHGQVDAGHVLLSPGGLVLCSLGRGGEAADDVAALGRLIAVLLEPLPDRDARGRRGRGARALARTRSRRRLGAMLAPPAAAALAALVAEATVPDRTRRPTARALAAEVLQRVPTATAPEPPAAQDRRVLPAPPRARRDPSRRLPRGAAPTAAVAAAAVAAFGVLTRADHGRGGSREAAGAPRVASTTRPDATPSTVPATTAPIATLVWPAEPMDYADGVLTAGGARYAVGGPGDAVVAGDWSCSGRRTVALLRPATGDVFAFDGWPPPDAEVPGRRLARVDGATGLRAGDADGDGCADLQVERSGRPPLAVEVAP